MSLLSQLLTASPSPPPAAFPNGHIVVVDDDNDQFKVHPLAKHDGALPPKASEQYASRGPLREEAAVDCQAPQMLIPPWSHPLPTPKDMPRILCNSPIVAGPPSQQIRTEQHIEKITRKPDRSEKSKGPEKFNTAEFHIRDKLGYRVGCTVERRVRLDAVLSKYEKSRKTRCDMDIYFEGGPVNRSRTVGDVSATDL